MQIALQQKVSKVEVDGLLSKKADFAEVQSLIEKVVSEKVVGWWS